MILEVLFFLQHEWSAITHIKYSVKKIGFPLLIQIIKKYNSEQFKYQRKTFSLNTYIFSIFIYSSQQ